jgi:hypothetical protein
MEKSYERVSTFILQAMANGHLVESTPDDAVQSGVWDHANCFGDDVRLEDYMY